MLFSANEVLQGCLLHVRGLCESASGSLTGVGEGDAAISLIVLNKTAALTLTDFMDAQRECAEKSLNQLNALKNKVVEIVYEACLVSCLVSLLNLHPHIFYSLVI